MAPRRSKKPVPKGGTELLTTVDPPVDYNEATPKFCLHHIDIDHCVTGLPEDKRADFAVALQQRCALTWREITLAGRHGMGSELVEATAIKPGVPAPFEDTARFTVLRYSGKLPMIGVRRKDVFHVLWIERQYGEVYDHE